MLRVRLTGRRMLLFGTFVLAALAFLYFVLPQLGGVKHTWDRLNEGDAWWIAVAVIVEVVSMASYIAIFQGVHVPKGSPIRWRHSYQITMAGLAATRLFAAGGAGGVAVTAWSLRRSGMESREVAQRMIAFLVLLYGVYMVALVVCGVGLYTGVFPGPHPFAITIVPAIVGAVGLLAIVVLAFVPPDVEQRLSRVERRRRVAHRPAGAALAGEVCDGHRNGVGWGALRPAEAAPPGMGAVGGGHVVGVQRRGVVRVLPCLRGSAAGGGAGAGVLRGDARQPAAAARRHRRGGRRDDRGAGGLRRGRRAGADRGAGVPPAGVLAAEHPRRDRLLPAAPHGRPLGAGGRARQTPPVPAG